MWFNFCNQKKKLENNARAKLDVVILTVAKYKQRDLASFWKMLLDLWCKLDSNLHMGMKSWELMIELKVGGLIGFIQLFIYNSFITRKSEEERKKKMLTFHRSELYRFLD